jgi:hypothetical protein
VLKKTYKSTGGDLENDGDEKKKVKKVREIKEDAKRPKFLKFLKRPKRRDTIEHTSGKT